MLFRRGRSFQRIAARRRRRSARSAVVPERETAPLARHAPSAMLARRANTRFSIVEGSVFAAPVDRGLAHCVALDFAMSVGIAVEFKARFGPVSPSDRARARVGGCLQMTGHSPGGERELFYLVTKKASNGRPTYGSLEAALREMVVTAGQHGVACIAMPRIGCGLDGLDWGLVEAMLRRILLDTPRIAFEVYVPPSAGAAASAPARPPSAQPPPPSPVPAPPSVPASSGESRGSTPRPPDDASQASDSSACSSRVQRPSARPRWHAPKHPYALNLDEEAQSAWALVARWLADQRELPCSRRGNLFKKHVFFFCACTLFI